MNQYQKKDLYLTFSPDPDMACDMSGGFRRRRVLNAHIGQHILTEDGPGVQVGCHETTLTG